MFVKERIIERKAFNFSGLTRGLKSISVAFIWQFISSCFHHGFQIWTTVVFESAAVLNVRFHAVFVAILNFPGYYCSLFLFCSQFSFSLFLAHLYSLTYSLVLHLHFPFSLRSSLCFLQQLNNCHITFASSASSASVLSKHFFGLLQVLIRISPLFSKRQVPERQNGRGTKQRARYIFCCNFQFSQINHGAFLWALCAAISKNFCSISATLFIILRGFRSKFGGVWYCIFCTILRFSTLLTSIFVADLSSFCVVRLKAFRKTLCQFCTALFVVLFVVFSETFLYRFCRYFCLFFRIFLFFLSTGFPVQLSWCCLCLLWLLFWSHNYCRIPCVFWRQVGCSFHRSFSTDFELFSVGFLCFFSLPCGILLQFSMLLCTLRVRFLYLFRSLFCYFAHYTFLKYFRDTSSLFCSFFGCCYTCNPIFLCRIAAHLMLRFVKPFPVLHMTIFRFSFLFFVLFVVLCELLSNAFLLCLGAFCGETNWSFCRA